MSGPATASPHVRKVTNVVALDLSGLATAIGLFFLGAILWTLDQERPRRHVGGAVHRRTRRRPAAPAAC